MIGMTLLDKAIRTIIRQESMHYEALWDGISEKQREVLIALATDDPACIFSKTFIEKWRFGVSSLQASLRALGKRGIVERP
jgi:hypothetical protein